MEFDPDHSPGQVIACSPEATHLISFLHIRRILSHHRSFASPGVANAEGVRNE